MLTYSPGPFPLFPILLRKCPVASKRAIATFLVSHRTYESPSRRSSDMSPNNASSTVSSGISSIFLMMSVSADTFPGLSITTFSSACLRPHPIASSAITAIPASLSLIVPGCHTMILGLICLFRYKISFSVLPLAGQSLIPPCPTLLARHLHLPYSKTKITKCFRTVRTLGQMITFFLARTAPGCHPAWFISDFGYLFPAISPHRLGPHLPFPFPLLSPLSSPPL